MAEPVRVRRLTDQEGQQLQQIARRGVIRIGREALRRLLQGRGVTFQRKERTRIRSEKRTRWGGRARTTTA